MNSVLTEISRRCIGLLRETAQELGWAQMKLQSSDCGKGNEGDGSIPIDATGNGARNGDP